MHTTFGWVGSRLGLGVGASGWWEEGGGLADLHLLASPLPQLQGAQRKLQQQEGEFRARERGLLGSLEEARGTEKQQLGHARSLELKLEAVRAEVAELGLRLSAAEGRAQGLEAELARVEAQRRTAEAQLGGLRSALRRGLGLGRSPSPAPRPVPGSPARSAPAGGSGEGLSSPSPLEHSPGSEPPSPRPATSPTSPDLEPEAVRGALREFIQELRSAQRERVRLGMSWLGNRVAERLQLVRAGAFPLPRYWGCRMSFGPRQVP